MILEEENRTYYECRGNRPVFDSLELLITEIQIKKRAGFSDSGRLFCPHKLTEKQIENLELTGDKVKTKCLMTDGNYQYIIEFAKPMIRTVLFEKNISFKKGAKMFKPVPVEINPARRNDLFIDDEE